MSKYEQLLHALRTDGTGTMTVFGNSMQPILQSGTTLTFVRQDTYAVGDIVFCKVNGRYIDAHKVTKVGPDGRFMISNNKGHENGWTRTIYGRAVRSLHAGCTQDL